MDWLSFNVVVIGSVVKVYYLYDFENIVLYFYFMYDEMFIDWLMSQWIKIKFLEVVYCNNKEFFLVLLFEYIGV